MIIVTGGAGFIGSNLIRGLQAKGAGPLVVVDNLGSSLKHKNLNAFDIADYFDKTTFLAQLPKLGKIDAVFHEGACSSTTESNGLYITQNNYEFSKTLFHFCQENKIPFYYASSASVYGNGDLGFKEERRAESPLNLYAWSKFQFDQYLRQKWSKLESQVIGLRYFNVYGPQENHKGRMASVVYQFHHKIAEQGKLQLFAGSDTFLRDFIHVQDIVNINLHFFEHREISGIINAGTGQARSFMDIAQIMSNLHGQAPIETIPFPEDLKGKYQAYTQADLTQLRTLGYDKPFISLEEGVTSYAKMLQENEGYWSPT